MINHLPVVSSKPRKVSGSSAGGGSILKTPSMRSVNTDDGGAEVSHSLFDDADLQLNDEIEDLNNMTKNLSKNIDEELKGITSTLEERKKGFFEEAIRNETEGRQRRNSTSEGIDSSEIQNRRREFVEKDLRNNSGGNNSSAALGTHEDLPKTRHKVRRINSNAQLNAVFRKRRQMSEVDAVEGDQPQQKQNSDQQQQQNGQETKQEISNVLNDIQNHYG